MTYPVRTEIGPGFDAMRGIAQLHDHWESRSRLAGWAYPSDWPDPAVDALCEACLGEGDVWAAAERLGRSRAIAGVPLAETLADLDALADLVAADVAAMVVRAATLGWADGVGSSETALVDALTGLVSVGYLSLRLAEVYQAAEAEDARVSERSALVVVQIGPSGQAVWRHVAPMILVGEALRTVFAAGETLSRLGDRVAVALTARDPLVSRRARLVADLVATGLAGDRNMPTPTLRVWLERLPTAYPAALDLITELGR